MAENGGSSAPAWSQRVHPKLRVMLNSDPSVNAVRSETTGCLAVKHRVAQAAPPLASAAKFSAAVTETTDPGKLDQAAPHRKDVIVSVFVETDETFKGSLKGVRMSSGRFSMLQVPVDEVEEIAKKPGVMFVEPAENLKPPGAIRLASQREPPRSRAANIEHPNLHADGSGVLIGIIDVEGFDWLHPDFEGQDGKTRFHSIWDQGATNRTPPKSFTRGSVITRDQMIQAVKDAKKVGVSPHDLEPQSQMVPGSHGTHVASIAAGNHGICPRAEIAAVLVSMPPDENDRRTSFYDSSCLLEAIHYLVELADSLNKPVSINISLGTNGHAHDGSSSLDRWIDSIIAKPGRSICVAAGNAGQEREEMPGDLGYVLGRIHTSGRLAAKGLVSDIDWVVAGDSIIDASENELEIWYEPQDRIAVSVKTPDGKWIGPVEPGEFVENLQLPDKSMMSIYNELYHPANGNNYMSIYLTPFMGKNVIIGVPSGAWTVRLHGLDIRDGRFHGWIERDDPQRLDDTRWYWPSYFSERSNVDECSVSSLACGQRVISVANLDEERQKVNISSSQGPTRDGRQKPDIAARGTAVRAANGFADADEPWIEMTGTSMASPHVCGTVGLMLSARRELTAAQVVGILKTTARPLAGGNYAWVNDCGFGAINPGACVEQAETADIRTDIKSKFAPKAAPRAAPKTAAKASTGSAP